MLNLTWDDFDKAFWVSSTNIENLINSSINLDKQTGQLEGQLANINSTLQNVADILDKIQESDEIMDEYVTEVADLAIKNAKDIIDLYKQVIFITDHLELPWHDE